MTLLKIVCSWYIVSNDRQKQADIGSGDVRGMLKSEGGEVCKFGMCCYAYRSTCQGWADMTWQSLLEYLHMSQYWYDDRHMNAAWPWRSAATR